jgi:acetyl-CoA acetyltransferase
MSNAVIVDAVRTPIGRAVKGSLKDVRADDLAAIPLRALLERNPQLDPASIVDVMMGAAAGEGEQGYNVARNALALAGYPVSVPGTTVNRFCASSLQTIRMAFHAIAAGEGDTYVAAGVEAVSRLGGGSPVPFHRRPRTSPSARASRARRRTAGRRSRRTAQSTRRRPATSTGRSSPSSSRSTPPPTRTAKRSRSPRRPSRRTTARAPARPRRSWPS